MSTSPSAIQALARLLISEAAAQSEAPGTDPNPTARACARLATPLIKLVGETGFASLLSRALSIAKRQAPLLEALHVQPNGSLTGFPQTPVDTTASTLDAGTILVSELLGLLGMFVGESLTLSLVREVCPSAWSNADVPSTKESL